MEQASEREHPLVNRCFVIFGPENKWCYQGIVKAHLGEMYFLIQYFDAIMGEPNTMAIVHVNAMQAGRHEGAWEFFEDDAHLRDWIETFGRR